MGFRISKQVPVDPADGPPLEVLKDVEREALLFEEERPPVRSRRQTASRDGRGRGAARVHHEATPSCCSTTWPMQLHA